MQVIVANWLTEWSLLSNSVCVLNLVVAFLVRGCRSFFFPLLSVLINTCCFWCEAWIDARQTVGNIPCSVLYCCVGSFQCVLTGFVSDLINCEHSPKNRVFSCNRIIVVWVFWLNKSGKWSHSFAVPLRLIFMGTTFCVYLGTTFCVYCKTLKRHMQCGLDKFLPCDKDLPQTIHLW